jgi:RNA-directed DNA polymerase
LANIALDGLEREFGCERPNGRLVSPALRRGKNHGLNLIRYADDFVVTAPSREVLESYVIPTVQAFFAQRGLTLSEAKTQIVHVDEGFNFLGFEIRRFGGTLLTKPQKEKVLNHLRAIKTYLNEHKQTPVSNVIKELGPIIRGWAYYYRHCAAKETFSKASHQVWAMAWIWAKRRHPNKSRYWIKERYFKDDGYWTFTDGTATLYRHNATPITRFTKVIGRSSPMDPQQRAYWEERKKRNVARETFRKERLEMLQGQNNACGLCGITFWPGDPVDDHHRTPQQCGGGNENENRMLVHRWCHHGHHRRHGCKVTEA